MINFRSIIQCQCSEVSLEGTFVSASFYLLMWSIFTFCFREFIGSHQGFPLWTKTKLLEKAQFAFHVMEAGQPNRWKRTSLCNLWYHGWKSNLDQWRTNSRLVVQWPIIVAYLCGVIYHAVYHALWCFSICLYIYIFAFI